MAMNPELEAKLRAAANGNNAGARASQLRERVEKAIDFERKGDLDGAFKAYTALYNEGFVPAAFYLGNLFMHRGFRAIEVKNEQTGTTVHRPDLKSALAWYQKAADRGIREAMCNAGIMMVMGQGCEADVEGGKRYLIRAKDAGSEEARSFLFQNFADQRTENVFTDEEYGDLLTRFIKFSSEANAAECHKLFFKLVCGNDEQLSSLGTVLALHKYSTNNAFVNRMNQNSYPKLSNGMPCVPVYLAKRVPGATTLHLNTRCFPEGKIRLTICSSIDDLTLFPLSGIDELENTGVVTYSSAPFGGLPGTRSARIMEFTVEEGADVCIFTENGEKEYITEIGWLDDADKLHFLFRYAVDIRAADIPSIPTVLSIVTADELENMEAEAAEADNAEGSEGEPLTEDGAENSDATEDGAEDEAATDPEGTAQSETDPGDTAETEEEEKPEKKGFFKRMFGKKD